MNTERKTELGSTGCVFPLFREAHMCFSLFQVVWKYRLCFWQKHTLCISWKQKKSIKTRESQAKAENRKRVHKTEKKVLLRGVPSTRHMARWGVSCGVLGALPRAGAARCKERPLISCPRISTSAVNAHIHQKLHGWLVFGGWAMLSSSGISSGKKSPGNLGSSSSGFFQAQHWWCCFLTCWTSIGYCCFPWSYRSILRRVGCGVWCYGFLYYWDFGLQGSPCIGCGFRRVTSLCYLWLPLCGERHWKRSRRK